MRIAAAADLHFTPQNYDRIREPMSHVRDEADVLVLAGDLTNYGKPDEMESLLNALVRLRIPTVAVLGTHDYESGQPQEIYPYLGSARLAEVVDRHGAEIIVHGHAHHGAGEGRTTGGIPVYNVSLPILQQQDPPKVYRVFDV